MIERDLYTYTHFWATGPDHADLKRWNSLCKDARTLFHQHPSLIYRDTWAVVHYGSNKEISFVPPKAGEFGSFLLSYDAASFCFCRTDHQPYDLLVKCVLLAAKKNLQNWITLTSDGSWQDWQDAVSVCRESIDLTEEDVQAAKADFDALLIPRPGKD